jgi:hypothetical protein
MATVAAKSTGSSWSNKPFEHLSVEPNDDGTFLVRVTPPYKRKKDGSTIYTDSVTITAETLKEVVAKVEKVLKAPKKNRGDLAKFLSPDD